MSIIHFERTSDSPYIQSITCGRTESDGSTIRPAETHWHMVFARHNGRVNPLLVGPWTSAGVASWGKDAEILWVKFKLGVFMPHLPIRDFLDTETLLPEAASRSFWLKGTAWQFPDYDNVEVFVSQLVRDEVLVRDPLVEGVFQDRPPELSARTLRHRFLQASGLTQGHIRQFKRSQRAVALLQAGASILDTVFQLGYYDQPHLTRSLKHFIGHTPGQIVQMGASG